MKRFHARAGDQGAYAILYAVLVVVLVGMGAVVVDFAAVRQDRRIDRLATDNAALGGVGLLDPTSAAGPQPYQACLQAFGYLKQTFHLTDADLPLPGGRCSAFSGVNATSYCAVAAPAQLKDDVVVGTRTIRVAWPVATGADQGFLTPDLAPATVPPSLQPTNTAPSPGPTNTDGYDNGCDKLGVAVFQNQSFGLGTMLGFGGTTTQVHSVARILPNQGPPGNAAALNVLADDCETLTAKGGGANGFVFVGPVLKQDGTVAGPGVISVESSAMNCTGGNTAIDVTGGNVICASRSAVTASSCTGDGIILSHALDPGQNAAAASTGNASQLKPNTLTPEGGVSQWAPVTKFYGCNSLSGCNSPSTNYIRLLVNTYKGPGVPGSVYDGGQAPYVNPYPGPFVDKSAQLCPPGGGITGLVMITAGNNYANCTIRIASSGILIVQGGTLVVDGGVQNAGCFVMNTLVATCPTGVVNGGTAKVTTPIPPTSDAILYIRGNSCPANKCFDNSGALILPQTFAYSQSTTAPLNQSGTLLTLWTAPDAGRTDASGNTTLDLACKDPSSGRIVSACVDSRFGRLTYWNEAPFATSNPNVFVGQSNLNVVGIFFTPLGAFKFQGGSGYASAAAQFWSAYLTVGGGAQLGISPIDRFSAPPLGPRLTLIR